MAEKALEDSDAVEVEAVVGRPILEGDDVAQGDVGLTAEVLVPLLILLELALEDVPFAQEQEEILAEVDRYIASAAPITFPLGEHLHVLVFREVGHVGVVVTHLAGCDVPGLEHACHRVEGDDEDHLQVVGHCLDLTAVVIVLLAVPLLGLAPRCLLLLEGRQVELAQLRHGNGGRASLATGLVRAKLCFGGRCRRCRFQKGLCLCARRVCDLVLPL